MNTTWNFQKINTYLAWVAFALSLSLYLFTLEPTVSFWDCGEFLSCAAKLEVPHAPGAPFFILLGRIAAILNPSNPTVMINGLSAVASAFTIFFLFLTISWFGRKLFAKSFGSSEGQKVIILAGAFIGAMAYAVSDSFWFSAVETEVYALSSLFTAVVFWGITKWEEYPVENNFSDRWLLFIAYLFGLSIGVHLLNLLAIPAIVLVYFLKKYPVSPMVIAKALAVSVLFLAGFLLLIPGIPAVLSSFELLAVNHFGLPFNFGLITGIVFIALILGAMRYFFLKKGKLKLCNAILYLTLVLIGFSSYGLVLVRSHDNTPIDMSNPDNPFSLEDYLNREQYGKRPLLFGQTFASPVVATNERYTYQRFNGKYVKSPLNPDVVYDKNTLMLFPRMSDSDPGNIEAYKQWIGDYKGTSYYSSAAGKQVQIPTFSENMKFLFTYQLGHMYFRYLLWNFAGRQNDILGHGNSVHGNWISGLSFIDNFRLGNQEQLPTNLKNNPARNRYFFIPLIIGLLGLWYQFKADRKRFWIALLLFFFTGIAIALYLNEVPVIPRERDYVYVGSFYVFSIWIGMGVMAIYAWLGKQFSNEKIAGAIAIGVTLTVPVIMVAQNYDDHNRSGRYGVLEYARNYLASCAPNAILFTNADNDTYPLWYAQEVAGIRRDVRIILLPYLAADWYVEQMRQPLYNQEGTKMKLSQDKFIGGQRVYLPVVERTDSTIDLNEFIEFAGSEDPRVKLELTSGEKINYVPSRNFYLPVAQNVALPEGLRQRKKADSIDIKIKGSHLRMDNLVLLDIIASNNWERPVYFASPQEPMNLGFHHYLQLDGYAFKLIPVKEASGDYNNIGCIDIERLYRQYMHDFTFASIENSKIYLDYSHISNLNVVALRNKFARLAGELMNIGDSTRAEKVLDRIVALLPNSRLPFDLYNLEIAKLYMLLGKKEKGRKECIKLKTFCIEHLSFYNQLPRALLGGVNYEIRLTLYMLQQTADTASRFGYEELAKECSTIWENLAKGLIPELGIANP